MSLHHTHKRRVSKNGEFQKLFELIFFKWMRIAIKKDDQDDKQRYDGN